MPTLIPEEHWTSQGRTQLYAEEMVHLQEQLIQWAYSLKLPPRETELFIELAPDCHHSELQEDLLLHDDALLPLWKDFAEAVSNITASAYQCFLVIIQDVQLAKPVIDLLAPALNQAPIGGLLMSNNRMPREGIRFVSRLVELNSSLKCLAACNKLETEQDAVALAQAVRQHPNIESLILHDVGLGRSPAVMSAIMPAFHNNTLEAVSLGHNELGSHGANLLSNFLATNPTLKTLHLDKNLLKDSDVFAIASSLENNTNLEELNLHANKFGRVGADALLGATYCNWPSRTLNAIHGANHTCHIKFRYNMVAPSLKKTLTEESSNLIFNGHEGSPSARRKAKLFHAIASNTDEIDLKHFNNMSIKAMPNALAFLQDENANSSLNRLFQVMREWKMPLLYTNIKGSKRTKRKRNASLGQQKGLVSDDGVLLRRSARIRKLAKI